MLTFVKGNEAVVIGALNAGCEMFFGYPITPASEIAHCASRHFPATGNVFLQAECETASINMVYGAACAGKAAMTASSGPGISLMQEGLSYMAGAELPGIIVNIQRAGPGLGNIFPEQADYNQAVKGGGHGNYHLIVLAPGDVQEMCDLTIKAFELSFKYRNPACVLADAILGQMMETMRLPSGGPVIPDASAWAVRGDAGTKGNLITSIYLDARQQEAINLKLEAKYQAMAGEAMAETWSCDDADIVLCAYGSSARVARSAAERLREHGVKAGTWRPISLYPFPLSSLAAAARPGRSLLAVELSNGQFRDDISFQLGRPRSSVGLLNKMGGVLLSVEDVEEAALGLLQGGRS
jgi:2-oxoisovalerate ferredoxin oxidoreductase alpha subunit